MNWKAFLQALAFAAGAGVLQVVANGGKLNGSAVAAGAASGALGYILKSPLAKAPDAAAQPNVIQPAPPPPQN